MSLMWLLTHDAQDGLVQLTAGGLFAILIVREVLGYLKTKKNGDHLLVPMMTGQAEMLKTIRDTNGKLLERMTEMSAGIAELVDMNRRQRG